MSELLNKAFTLLNLLKPRDGCNEWSSAELARMAGYNNATTHRILQNMQKYGLVEQKRQSKKFYLGSSLIQLGYFAKNLFTISNLARPYMEELGSLTKETIMLSILVDDNEALLIDSVESSLKLRVTEPLGLRLPLHIGSTRRVILANMKKELQDEYIRNCKWELRTHKTITNEIDLRRDLNQINEQGYGISYNEATLGTAGIAVPIFGVDGVEGSLAITLPEFRCNEDVIPIYLELLFSSSKKLSHNLGGEIWIQH